MLLPTIAACITGVIGLVNFFHPRLMLAPMQIQLDSPLAVSEARGVFGGMNLAMAAAALGLNSAEVYTALGIGWGGVLLARFWSLAVDNIGIKMSLPAIILDGGLCFLFLSPVLLG